MNIINILIIFSFLPYILSYDDTFILDPISKLITINNGTGFIKFTSDYEYNNISINNINFNLNKTNSIYSSILQINDYGEFDIYLNNEPTSIQFINEPYINTYNTSISLYSNIITPSTTLTNNNISYWIIATTVILCSFVLFVIFCAYHKNKSITEEFLYTIDKLYITYKKDMATLDISEEVHEVNMGLGYECYDKTSTMGGIFTILLFIVSIFILVSYFYDTSEQLLTTSFSTGNNNIISMEKSTLYTKLTFKNTFYTQCNDCNNWKISANNILMNEPICTQNSDECSIEYQCSNCQIDVGNDVNLYFLQTNPYIGYEALNYVVTTTSYNGPESLLGQISTENIFTGSNNTIISLSIIPTIFTENMKSENGFILDYQNIKPGSTVNVANYSNLYNEVNEIGVNIKISRNPNWLYITSGEKISSLQKFAELYGLLGGLWASALLIINIIVSKPMRRFVFITEYYMMVIFYCKRDKKEINIEDKIKEIEQIEKKYVK